jgi:hypothetical protein
MKTTKKKHRLAAVLVIGFLLGGYAAWHLLDLGNKGFWTVAMLLWAIGGVAGLFTSIFVYTGYEPSVTEPTLPREPFPQAPPRLTRDEVDKYLLRHDIHTQRLHGYRMRQ